MKTHEPKWKAVFRDEVANIAEYECEVCGRFCKTGIYPPQFPSIGEHYPWYKAIPLIGRIAKE